jgi:nicotinamide riboside transporter PnuC
LGAGLFGIILAATLAIVVIAARISGMVVVPGYAALMVALTFFAGLNSLGLGLIGSYAWRAYENSKQRPLALVLRQHDFSGEQH